METIFLKDVANGTSTAREGTTLYNVLNKYLEQGIKVQLSFKDTTPMSASFFNTSLRKLSGIYGKYYVSDHVIAVDILPKHLQLIQYYFTML